MQRIIAVCAVCFAAGTGAASGLERLSFFEAAKLLAADGMATDNFGVSVAISGDTALVGAYSDDDVGGSAYVFQRKVGYPRAWLQVAKLTAADPANDRFGTSVAISGDTALVGVWLDDDLGENSGSAYVFRRHAGGPDAWGEVAKLTASDGDQDDWFGITVALSGDTAVVGARHDEDLGEGSGSAYVFQHDAEAGAWREVTKLNATDGDRGALFGGAVGIHGDTVVVGAYGDDDFALGAGSAYIFHRDAGGQDAWGQVAKLIAADGAELDYFGVSVAISRDTVVVGANRSVFGVVGPGAAYVYRRDAGGSEEWGQVAKLTARDGEDDDYFGDSVAIDGDTVVMGAYGDDDLGSGSGAVYAFHRDTGGPEGWGQIAKLTTADGAAVDEVGRGHVGLSGRTAVVGAWHDDDRGAESGSAYIFERTLVEPSLSVVGTCPGELILTGTGATPKGRLELYWGFREEASEIGSGPCVGTPLDLDEARLLIERRAGSDGERSCTVTVDERACGRYLEFVDLASCAVSGAVQVP